MLSRCVDRAGWYAGFGEALEPSTLREANAVDVIRGLASGSYTIARRALGHASVSTNQYLTPATPASGRVR